jgi:pimeloyl-ACP methyl ester carboxylesterase
MKQAAFKLNLFILAFLLFFGSCSSSKTSHHSEIQLMTFNGSQGDLNYAWSGDPTKQPLLFIHGSPGSWETWARLLLEPEMQKDFHLIAIDRPGYGGSRPGIAVPSLSQQAAEALEVLAINKSQRPALLVGYSFGGTVIAKAAIDHPERIAGMVLVASPANPELEITRWYQQPALWWPLRILIPNFLRVSNEEKLSQRSELSLLLPFWKSIKVPSVLIHGESDNIVSLRNLDFIIGQMDSKMIVKVLRQPELNHYVPENRPDLIVEGIKVISKTIRRNHD